MKRGARFVVAWLAAVLVAACATLPGSLERPKVTVAGLSLIDAGLFEQRFGLKLRVQNPNDVDLAIQGLSYDLEINEQPFGSGVANAGVTVPKYGSTVIDVELISNLGGLLRQLSSLSKDNGFGLRYRLKGNVVVGPLNTRLPFEESGEIGPPGRTSGTY